MRYVLLLSAVTMSLGVSGCRTVDGAVYDTSDLLKGKSGTWGRNAGSFQADE